MRATHAVIHLENLRHNLRVVKQLLGPGRKICLAVKADAYGHGAVPIAKAGLAEGATHLGVATVEEGIQLRQAEIKAPILLLSLPDPTEIPELVHNELTPLVADEGLVKLLAAEASRQGKRLNVHLKVDTGMRRIGCKPQEALALAQLVAQFPSLYLEGLATHFAQADAPSNQFTRTQLDLFLNLMAEFKAAGIRIKCLHAANSAALLSFPPSFLDMVRPGIMLYGYYPSPDLKTEVTLKPVMEFKTRICFIKSVPAGCGISYGLTYVTLQPTRIATLPVGYADGYSRLLSNRGRVLIHGRLYPVAGRVCMDQTMIDLQNNPEIKINDEVVLFGGPGAPDAQEIADLMGTIPYEVTCLISKRVPRLYTDEQ